MPPIARACKLACLAVMAVWASACAGAPCASSARCGAGEVCGLDGACGPLSGSGSRSARSRWMLARDWAVASSASALPDDALPLGGPEGAEALLSFAPLPSPSTLLRALLVLHPHDPLARVERAGELVVEHVQPFRGVRLPPRHTRAPAALAAQRVTLPAGAARPARVDLTHLAREAAARRDRALNVLVRLEDGSPAGARFASPWSPGARTQPRLELTLR